MAPSILIVGATGTLAATSNALFNHRVIAPTRSLDSPSKTGSKLTPEWLREHEVARAFIASHNNPNQFAEESTFHLAALQANVKYVVRISTTAANVRPDSNAYYARAYWAIEALLASPEFERMQWTSLQPNIFSQHLLAPAVKFIQRYRKTGEQDTLKLMVAEHDPMGIIDRDEVGVFAADLLAQDDTTVHNKAKYILNGPDDITGAQTVEMIEQRIGARVKDVSYWDLSFLESYYEHKFAARGESRNVILSMKRAMRLVWD
ncbi:hypothetical protein BDW71DRAFT_217721 [Aspergillus fruticulosus]